MNRFLEDPKDTETFKKYPRILLNVTFHWHVILEVLKVAWLNIQLFWKLALPASGDFLIFRRIVGFSFSETNI
jgi:hypothetical protein